MSSQPEAQNDIDPSHLHEQKPEYSAETSDAAASKTPAATSKESNASIIPKAFQSTGNGLWIPGWAWAEEPVEAIFTYGKGGNLPVHLGFSIGRYKVVHKLDIQHLTNIWLCRDTEAETPKYYAVKVLLANTPKDSPELWIGRFFKSIGQERLSVHLLLPIEHLKVESPNGSHHVLVFPLEGPTIRSLFHLRTTEEGENDLRSMSHQITHALHVMHASGMCHGNFTDHIIIAGIKGIDGRSEEEILEDIGRPEGLDVKDKKTDKLHDEPWAPQYVVSPINWDNTDGDSIDITKHAYVSDFSQVFVTKKPPKHLSLAIQYSAPEWIFDKEAGEGTDIWSLGCSLFRIRTGSSIFPGRDEHDVLMRMALVLGKLPDPWWTKGWERRHRIFEEKADKDGKAILLTDDSLIAALPRSIKEAIKYNFAHIDKNAGGSIPRDMEDAEIDLLADLLMKIFKWKPEERISAKEAMNHPWFSYGLKR